MKKKWKREFNVSTDVSHTQTKTWRHAVPVCLSFGRSQGKWRPLDSECLTLRDLKDSGTKLMRFNVKGVDMKEDFRKGPEDRRSDQICLLTVDSHCQSTCKVCVQCQSSISCSAELLTARHLIRASKRFLLDFWLSNLHCHFVKPHVFTVSRTDLLSCLGPNQCCTPQCEKTKGIFQPSFSKAKCELLPPRQSGVLRISPSRKTLDFPYRNRVTLQARSGEFWWSTLADDSIFEIFFNFLQSMWHCRRRCV